MKRGLPAKFLFIPGVIIFLIIVGVVSSQFLSNEAEYQKDQAHLREVMEGKLPENPVLQVKLPVKGYIIPSGVGFCMVDAAAGIANYLEPDIDLDKFLLLGNPTLFMAARNKNERYGPGGSIMRTFINLGYTPFRGVTSSIHPPQNVSMDIEPQNFIYFKNKEEELVFMKKLLSAGIIPIVTLTRDPFEPIEGGLFTSLVGYDQNGVWLNVSPPSEKYAPGKYYMELPERYEPRFLTYDKFFKFWTPDHQFLWVIKTGSRKTETEMYATNKKNAQETPLNIQKTIEFLKANGDLLLFTSAFNTPTAMTFYRYFQQQGHLALANQYLELAKTYESIRETRGSPDNKQTYFASILGIDASGENRQTYIKTLESVYPYYAQIAPLWP